MTNNSITDAELDAMAAQWNTVRRLVPLQKGEKQPTTLLRPLPKGMREETDEELRKRVLGHVIA